MSAASKTSAELRLERLRVPDPDRCGELVIAAPWPKRAANLGTLARTADALEACFAVPDTTDANRALRHGLTVGEHSLCLHRLDDPDQFLRSWPSRIVLVELARPSISLAGLRPSLPGEPTLVVVGHEANGVPAWVFSLPNVEVCEIPMSGCGNSLNVAVAGSLVAYKLRGLLFERFDSRCICPTHGYPTDLAREVRRLRDELTVRAA